ncbi:MAG: hypothetical protein IJN17_00100 [Clostridia bacterium]|nr:hypothetical protein [Clostridia bacterium]
MKKAVALLMILAMSLTLLCGCGGDSPAQAPEGMKALESTDKLEYNIYVPYGWTQDLSTGAVSAYAGSSDLSSIVMTQYTYDTQEAKDLLEYTNNYTDELSKTFTDFKLAEDSPLGTTLDGLPAYKIEYTGKLAGKEYKFMQVICLKGGATIYFFTYTSLSTVYDSHLDDVNKILDNFDFK